MAWEKVSDSRWERAVDGLEGYFVTVANITAGLCDGREHYTLFSKIKLEKNDSDAALEPVLQHAWKQLRFEQPQLATTSSGMKKVYEVPDAVALEEWLKSTFIVSSASDAEELYAVVTPIKQATLYYVPKSSELIFRGHHHTIDGNGMLLFWDSFLKALSRPNLDLEFGSEPARLAPTTEAVLGFREQPTPQLQQQATDLFMSWAGYIPGIGPVSKVGAVPSSKCQNAELVFSPDMTEAVIGACKKNGITVTAAVHAAYIGAIVKHADPKSKLSQYVTATQFNLRRYLPEPHSKSAVSVYYTPLPYKVDLPTSYWDIAKSLHHYYQTSFRDNPGLLEIKGHFVRALCGAVQTPEFLAAPTPTDALVSSLGIIEDYLQREYGGFKVKDIQLGADIVMGMSMFFFYTFRDQLRLVYSFNDGFEKAEDIQMYLEEVQAILSRELLA
ncbi:hypothetical protein F4778DRAFT_236210 [Xylariomycetidae sp. FL2044]|nr:hypothetical protein F4778DRAFT_236210 [Xylariomycetidae sp. FL2044]